MYTSAMSKNPTVSWEVGGQNIKYVKLVVLTFLYNMSFNL